MSTSPRHDTSKNGQAQSGGRPRRRRWRPGETGAHRAHRTRALGLLAAVGLLLTLAVPGAATGHSRVSATAALQGMVRIHLQGSSSGDVGNSSRGRFTISGAISDRGRYVDSEVRRHGYDIVRRLVGAKGIIWIEVGFLEPFPCQCNWRISRATGAYTGLRGQGHEEGRYGRSIVLTMKGKVSL